ncbi:MULTISPECIES: hypothetical protein [Streptomyces violaceoruber group]|uniref:Uncharacterized protein n=1 Tax=Streptomyces rubrogriseus TaxID=194673 RepID=A0A6G3TAF6_9ACTN|nr:hypothetical protein [Streptomyces rubrogriseus]
MAERPVGIGRTPQENLDVGYMISLIHQLAVREPGDCENATVHQLESLLKGFSAAQRASPPPPGRRPPECCHPSPRRGGAEVNAEQWNARHPVGTRRGR